jgi:hypothetical protein
VEICVDLWTIGNVAIHLRHPPSRGALLRTGGYGGQDVKVLPVPIFNVEWERVVGVVFRWMMPSLFWIGSLRVRMYFG